MLRKTYAAICHSMLQIHVHRGGTEFKASSPPSPTCSLELGPELEVNKDPIPESHPQCWGSEDKHRNDGVHSVQLLCYGH